MTSWLSPFGTYAAAIVWVFVIVHLYRSVGFSHSVTALAVIAQQLYIVNYVRECPSRCLNNLVLPNVFCLTRARSRNSAIPSSVERTNSAYSSGRISLLLSGS